MSTIAYIVLKLVKVSGRKRLALGPGLAKLSGHLKIWDCKDTNYSLISKLFQPFFKGRATVAAPSSRKRKTQTRPTMSP